MNTREQIIEWRDTIKANRDAYQYARSLTASSLNDFNQKIELLDKLIAERPYEPGDQVMHGGEVCYFYCVSPVNDCIYIIGFPNGKVVPALAEDVKPLPKTYRVTVPEDKMKKAESLRKLTQLGRAPKEDLLEILCHVSNPDNWEAGND